MKWCRWTKNPSHPIVTKHIKAQREFLHIEDLVQCNRQQTPDDHFKHMFTDIVIEQGCHFSGTGTSSRIHKNFECPAIAQGLHACSLWTHTNVSLFFLKEHLWERDRCPRCLPTDFPTEEECVNFFEPPETQAV